MHGRAPPLASVAKDAPSERWSEVHISSSSRHQTKLRKCLFLSHRPDLKKKKTHTQKQMLLLIELCTKFSSLGRSYSTDLNLPLEVNFYMYSGTMQKSWEELQYRITVLYLLRALVPGNRKMVNSTVILYCICLCW